MFFEINQGMRYKKKFQSSKMKKKVDKENEGPAAPNSQNQNKSTERKQEGTILQYFTQNGENEKTACEKEQENNDNTHQSHKKKRNRTLDSSCEDGIEKKTKNNSVCSHNQQEEGEWEDIAEENMEEGEIESDKEDFQEEKEIPRTKVIHKGKNIRQKENERNIMAMRENFIKNLFKDQNHNNNSASQIVRLENSENTNVRVEKASISCEQVMS